MYQVKLFVKMGFIKSDILKNLYWLTISNKCYCKYKLWSQVIINVALQDCSLVILIIIFFIHL